MRYKAIVEYDGTEFSGWQLQLNGPSIQGAIEAALQQIARRPVRIFAAGRTDAGVHALGQVISFDLDYQRDAGKLQRALNGLTPRSIILRTLEGVSDDFDPRRMARCRAYVYRIWNAQYRSPFWQPYAWHVARPLDLAAMQHAADDLVGDHDFAALRAASCGAKTSVRRIFVSQWQREESLLTYRIEATAFLRHMVRTIVGTLVEVGLGVRPADNIPRLLQSRDRLQAAATAPAHGLVLARVDY